MASTEFLKYGWQPAHPLTEDTPYDLIIKRPSKNWETVQSKTIYTSTTTKGYSYDCFSIRCIKNGVRVPYALEDCDLFVAVNQNTKEIYLVPHIILHGSYSSTVPVSHIQSYLLSESFNHSLIDTPSFKKPRHSNAKATLDIAEAIRESHKQGKSYSQLVKEFGLSNSSIARIIRNETWLP